MTGCKRARRNTNGLGLNYSFRKNFNPFYNTTALGSVRNQTQQSKMVFDDQQLNFFYYTHTLEVTSLISTESDIMCEIYARKKVFFVSAENTGSQTALL